MNCQKCNSDRVLGLSVKCTDRFYMSIDNKEYHGYVPSDLVLASSGYSDCLAFYLCLDCGQIQGSWPHELLNIESETDEDE